MLLRVFLAVVVRIERVGVVHALKHDSGNLLHLAACGYIAAQDAAEVVTYGALARTMLAGRSNRTAFH